jgi:hypothetical protein
MVDLIISFFLAMVMGREMVFWVEAVVKIDLVGN